MPDLTPTPAATPAVPTPHKRGYFNKAQLDDIETASDVLAAAQEHAADLAPREITAAYLTDFATAIQQARDKTNETGQATDAAEAATLHADGDERALVIALQGIQSAAKQKHRMLAGDVPPVDFSTDGYLIGERLNANRPALIQNATALIAKAAADSLPGYDAAAIQAVRDLLGVYQGAGDTQHSDDTARGLDKNERDALVRRIDLRRMAIQHAADAVWPYTDTATRPIRRAFHLPPSRPFNG